MPGARYWVQARTVGPLLLMVEDGMVCGELCADVRTSLYLWYPGGVKLLQVRTLAAS